MLRKLLSLCCCWGALSVNAFAATYDFPAEGSSMVGRTQYHVIEQGETLAQIAARISVAA